MDFGLSQDQVLLKDTIRRWLDAECPDDAGARGHGERRAATILRSGADSPTWASPDSRFRPAHGGAGLELLDVALAAEELGWACTPGPFLGSAMATVALLASDDAEAQRRWLPAIAAGEAIATVAHRRGRRRVGRGEARGRAPTARR